MNQNGTLGPRGSYSEMAAISWMKKAGKDIGNLRYFDDIPDVMIAVKAGMIELGIVPIENMIEGAVTDTLDLLAEYQLNISGEIYVKISHCLMTGSKDVPISAIISRSEALAQCKKFLKSRYPTTTLVPATSTSAAAQKASKILGYAAIASKRAAEEFNLVVLEENIQDSNENYTRFVIISNHLSEPSGNDKTSIIVYPHENKPGALCEILSTFAQRGIDLTKIDSRPTKKSFGKYLFHIDLKGHGEDGLVKEALKSILEKGHSLKILGSYPMAELNGKE